MKKRCRNAELLSRLPGRPSVFGGRRNEMEKYTKRTAEYLNSFLSGEGLRLIATEFVEEDHNWYLRVYIDLTDEEYRKRLQNQKDEETAETKAEATAEPGTEQNPETEAELPGVSIDDCVKISRRLSKWLDKEDFIREVYTLEVCSQGFLKDHETSE